MLNNKRLNVPAFRAAAVVLGVSGLVGCRGDCSDMSLDMDMSAENLKACIEELGSTHPKCLEIQKELDELKQRYTDECLPHAPAGGTPGETQTPEL